MIHYHSLSADFLARVLPGYVTTRTLGRKTHIQTEEERIDQLLSSLPPPQIDINNEKLLKRKVELQIIYFSYFKDLLSRLENMDSLKLEELKSDSLDIATNTERTKIKINGKDIPLHINARLSAVLFLSELYENYLTPKDLNPEDLKLLSSTLDDDINFPVCGKDFHRDAIENSAMLKAYIAKILAKTALQLDNPSKFQLSILKSLERIDKMLEGELKERPRLEALLTARVEINRAIFITAYYYNKSSLLKKDAEPLPEIFIKHSLQVLSRSPEEVLESENLSS